MAAGGGDERGGAELMSTCNRGASGNGFHGALLDPWRLHSRCQFLADDGKHARAADTRGADDKVTRRLRRCNLAASRIGEVSISIIRAHTEAETALLATCPQATLKRTLL